jgi:hypothetical protein
MPSPFYVLVVFEGRKMLVGGNESCLFAARFVWRAFYERQISLAFIILSDASINPIKGDFSYFADANAELP